MSWKKIERMEEIMSNQNEEHVKLIIAKCQMKAECDERKNGIAQKLHSLKGENKKLEAERASKELTLDKMKAEIVMQKRKTQMLQQSVAKKRLKLKSAKKRCRH